MKRNLVIPVGLFLVPAIFLLFLFEGCKKSTETPPPQTNPELLLEGSVIHATTHTGIANAQVYIGDRVLVTDAKGVFSIACKTLGSGIFDVRVKADGFGYGFATATIGSDAAMVNILALKPVGPGETIGQAGGTITIDDPESLRADGISRLVIPTGALTANTVVTFDRLTGIDVPGYAPDNLLNLCAFSIGPLGTVPAKPAELHLALPYNIPTVTSLPLLKYDFGQNRWNDAGVSAQIDQSANTATVQVTEFGTYSLGIPGNFSESDGTSKEITTITLDTKGSYIDLLCQASNQYPSGVPSTVSEVYLQNLASQNTRLYGARVSFAGDITYAYNYIGYKPDSLVPVKSTLTGYYRWIPKASHSLKQLSVTTVLGGITVTGILEKDAYTSSSGWQYIHDQGSGGK